MEYVKSLSELKQNMQTLYEYLDRKTEPEYSFALGRIKRGTCFVAEKTGRGYRFYPSRFIGYADNTMSRHRNNKEKDGRLTNPVISELIGKGPEPNEVLEKAYRSYCREVLGFEPNERGTFGVQRKFWLIG